MQTDKKLFTTSIKKAIGTLTKILEMVDKDQHCAEIGQQINASIGLLRSANTQLLKDHLSCCGAKAMQTNNPHEIAKFVDEFAKVRDMSVRK
jgi:DNA-binding FrmR family transcriptional regulator